MKHFYHTLTFVFLFGIANLSNAQITITESFFLDRIGTTETTTFFDLGAVDVTAIVNATGPNQTWDFSGFTPIDTFMIEQTYSQLPGTDVPGADLFPDADFAIELDSDTVSAELGEDVGFFFFGSLSDGYFRSYGSITLGDIDEDGTVDTLTTTFSPAAMENPIPLNYEDMWEDSTTTVFSFGGFEIPPTVADVNSYVVDGWGTLITPAGSFQALRLRTEFTQVNLVGGPDVFSHTDIEFLTMEGVSASIFIDNDGSTESGFGTSDNSMIGTSVEDEGGVPSEFQLTQNYPNPFNPSTTIQYRLPATSDVKLTVYTLTGQEVRTLVNATQEAGNYNVQFDAASLASGLYMYRLDAGTFSETRLMSLVK